MKHYIGTKEVKAAPMNRAEYNVFRGWDLPEDEDGTDEGYLVEYTDGGKPNVAGYTGYVSWSHKEQFEKAGSVAAHHIAFHLVYLYYHVQTWY